METITQTCNTVNVNYLFWFICLVFFNMSSKMFVYFLAFSLHLVQHDTIVNS